MRIYRGVRTRWATFEFIRSSSSRRLDAGDYLRATTSEASGKRVVYARAYYERVAVGTLIDYLTTAVEFGEEFPISRRQPNLAERPTRSNGGAERPTQGLQATLV